MRFGGYSLVMVIGETVIATVILPMFWWNSVANGGLLLLVEGNSINNIHGVGGFRSGVLWTSLIAPSNVGIAVAVTAMAGIALAATFVYSRRGSLKSPWSLRKRKHAVTLQQWRNLFTPDGKFRDAGLKFLKKARSGGVDPNIRKEVWPFLLGVYDLNSTQEERDYIRNQKREDYKRLRRQCRRLIKCIEKSIKPKKLSRTDSEGNSELIIDRLDSPGLEDIISTGDSISVRKECPECNMSDDKIHDRSPHTPNTWVEEDEGQSGITQEVAITELTESSDSDSEEMESLPKFSAIEGSGEGELPNNSSKDSTPTKPEIKSKTNSDEGFEKWQRIIRLDAIRANAEWVPYSPTQAGVSAEIAQHLAESVGLKDYDNLEPCRIFHAARLVSILEAYALYDPVTGYCQGMSDILSPMIAVIEEDYEAFWCFAGFMRKARHNFRLDEEGITAQLTTISKIIKFKDPHLYKHLEKLQADNCFFVYRMVVVLFRRELTFEQTLCLWEVMWADQAAIRSGMSKSAWGKIRQRAPPTEDLLLYAIAACVLQRRKKIIEKYSSMDEILRECNSMAGQLDVWKLLDDAHDLVVTLHEKI